MKFKNIKTNNKLLIAIGLLVPISVLADYQIRKFSVNSASGSSYSTRFDVSGSVAQVDDSSILTGGNFQINGAGFWHQNNDLIFKNDLE
ncbi:MAG: hypothetical protein R3F25_04055 [Gammaproteobacteria bacterium]|mgnify:CR=1 FL=1|jgi:hypothetical protein|nr:hypothetical protein [Xanthomonadales bacterium]MCB1603098.1 hypothetical protein [Xanthomonadales bacterium]